jgi:hypothetical protein
MLSRQGLPQSLSPRLRAACGALLLGALALAGCQSASSDRSGQVAMRVSLAGSASVAAVNYAVTGPTAVAGTIDASQGATVAAMIGPLAAGSGYTIDLTATASDGAVCKGSAGPFSVAAHVVSPVAVVLTCHRSNDSGTVTVDGTVSVCPGIDALVAAPSEAYVGNDIRLTATAGPDDQAHGFPLTWSWAGATSSDALGDAVFHCTAPGRFDVSLAVGNGNPACATTQPAETARATVTVTCTPAPDTKCAGPVGTLSGPLADGITFLDEQGVRVDAHGGGIQQEGDTFYLYGEYFPPGLTDGNFYGFSMYSSKDLATWKNEGIILPQQASGELGPNRKGERPHIIKCPATGEFVLFAHAADVTYQADKEIVYATSSTINGQYTYVGPIKNASGAIIARGDMGALVDKGVGYVIAESGHVYELAEDCHSWLSDRSFGAVNPPTGGGESPTVFRAGDTLYWIASSKTGWRANDNVYATASSMTGPWTQQGLLAPSGQKTWLSQVTSVTPVTGCTGTTYVFWGDHWYGTENDGSKVPGKHNDLATYVMQPLVFDGTKISLPTYLSTWMLDVGAGTWTK